MGVIEEIRIHGKKRKILRFCSQVMTLFYYMESKYGLERGLPPMAEVKENLKRIHSFCMEHYLVKAFAWKMGGTLSYSFDPEIDGVVANRKGSPIAVLEVKWKDLKKRDVIRFDEKTSGFDCDRMILTRNWSGGKIGCVRILAEDEIKDFLS